MKTFSLLFLMGFGSLSLLNALEHCHESIKSTAEDALTFETLQIEHLSKSQLRIHFSAIANEYLDKPEVSLSLFSFGIEMESHNYQLCGAIAALRRSWLRTTTGDANEDLKCSFSRGEKVKGFFDVSLALNLNHEDLLNEVKLEVRNVCVKQEVSLRDREHDLLTGRRFGFSEQEIDFLFLKWVDQHLDVLFLPEQLNLDPNLHTTSVLDERKQIFEENLMRIASHNSDGTQVFKMKMNQFGHLKFEEWKKLYASGLKPSQHHRDSRNYAEKTSLPNQVRLPQEVNWVKQGAVTEVKNQGACGSCWSFATTGALEGAYFLKTGKLVSFSEQELVSCDHVDLGCNGGSMDQAFDFVKENKGLCSEEAFPYTSAEGVRGFCNVTCTPVEGSAPIDFVDVQHDEMSLEEAVAKQPISVAIEADEPAFQFYSSGVLTAPCSQNLDHGVLLVGYGTEHDLESNSDLDYWLVKNSWGSQWGLEGYIKLERGVELEEGGECGILLGPSYPEL